MVLLTGSGSRLELLARFSFGSPVERLDAHGFELPLPRPLPNSGEVIITVVNGLRAAVGRRMSHSSSLRPYRTAPNGGLFRLVPITSPETTSHAPVLLAAVAVPLSGAGLVLPKPLAVTILEFTDRETR
jgi:hypothetical protein